MADYNYKSKLPAPGPYFYGALRLAERIRNEFQFRHRLGEKDHLLLEIVCENLTHIIGKPLTSLVRQNDFKAGVLTHIGYLDECEYVAYYQKTGHKPYSFGVLADLLIKTPFTIVWPYGQMQKMDYGEFAQKYPELLALVSENPYIPFIEESNTYLRLYSGRARYLKSRN